MRVLIRFATGNLVQVVEVFLEPRTGDGVCGSGSGHASQLSTFEVIDWSSKSVLSVSDGWIGRRRSFSAGRRSTFIACGGADG